MQVGAEVGELCLPQSDGRFVRRVRLWNGGRARCRHLNFSSKLPLQAVFSCPAQCLVPCYVKKWRGKTAIGRQDAAVQPASVSFQSASVSCAKSSAEWVSPRGMHRFSVFSQGPQRTLDESLALLRLLNLQLQIRSASSASGCFGLGKAGPRYSSRNCSCAGPPIFGTNSSSF